MATLYDLLKMMIEKNASDLHITTGSPPRLRIDGKLISIDHPSLAPGDTKALCYSILTDAQKHKYEENNELDLSFGVKGLSRFRANIFMQRGAVAGAFRTIPFEIRGFKDLGLPDIVGEMVKKPRGLILVTGPTGSGKSTTLAAMIDRINTERAEHIITVEDPIEYQHPHKKATFNQRELGKDFSTFATGLRAALRQAPKVILVGEMRDRETVEIGLSAAETGHLVFTTLHTVDAGQTINRILGMFSTEEENQIRIRLADTLRWVVCQRLLPKVGGGRAAAFEILGTSLRVKDSILHGESEGKTYYDMMEASRAFGWTTFDNYIIGLYEKGLITEETALGYSSRRSIVGRGIDLVKSSRGESTSAIDKLEIDAAYEKKLNKW